MEKIKIQWITKHYTTQRLSSSLRKIEANPYILDEDWGAFGGSKSDNRNICHWLEGFGLLKQMKLTPLGKLVRKYDPYFEQVGSWIAFHNNLVKTPTLFRLFYLFNSRYFTKLDFEEYCYTNGINNKSVPNDLSIIAHTYCRKPNCQYEPEEYKPYFEDLNLLNRVGKNYIKTDVDTELFTPELALYLFDGLEGEIKLQELFGLVGPYFNMQTTTLVDLIRIAEVSGKIKLIRTAGLDVVRFKEKIDGLKCLESYYKLLEYKIGKD